jgi:hypothetical protein
MKWMKQVFAQRYNAEAGRIGHIWGDRYWSRIVEGEPVESPANPQANGDRPHRERKERRPSFFLTYTFPPTPSPG